MNTSLHAILEDFTPPETNPDDLVVLQLRPRAALEATRKGSASAHLGEAFAKGFDEGQNARRKQYEDDVANLKKSHEEQIDGMRRELVEGVARDAAAQINEQINNLHSVLEHEVTDILMPVLRCVLTERAVVEMAGALQDLTLTSGAVTIEISGPADLSRRIWNRYLEISGDRALRDVRFHEADKSEILLTIDRTTVRSRLMQWLARLSEVSH